MIDIQQKFVYEKGLPIKCLIYWPKNEGMIEIGTWFLPGEGIDNYKEQESIGWLIMIALKQGAERVEVMRGDVNFAVRQLNGESTP